MSKKNIILYGMAMLLLLITSLVKNENLSGWFTITALIIILLMKITDHYTRKKILKQINLENKIFIKVRENNKWTIIIGLMTICIPILGVKNIYSLEQVKGGNSILSLGNFINKFGYSYRLQLFAFTIIFVIALIHIVQILFSSCIITEDKVLFHDDLVFDIDKIDDIVYEDSMMSKNKKIINIGRGFTDRQLIIEIAEFDKVKMLLESKNTN